MAEIPDGSVDMVLCDLPYGTTACAWDVVIPFEPLWSHYKRVIKPRGAIVLTASQPFTSALVMSKPGWFRYEWIWEKQKGTNFLWAKKMPMKVHENVLVFGRSLPRYFPQKTDLSRISTRVTYGKTTRANLRADCKAAGTTVVHENVGRYPRSIQKFASEGMNIGNLHPTQKPVALMEYLIRTYTEPGDLVLDNCMGSGTTIVAAMNTGRRAVGIELDPGYFEIARKRVNAAPPPLIAA